RVRSVAVGIRRAVRLVRRAVVDQGHNRTHDPVVAASQKGAAVAKTDGCCGPTGRGGRRLKRLVLPVILHPTFIPDIWNDRCRVFITALLKLPISTKARGIRSCSCMALHRRRTSTG